MYYGPEATEFVTQMLAGKEVVVVLDNISPSRDRYNRLLAWLEFTDGTRSSDPAALNGTCVNEQIVRNGFGYTDLRFDNDRYGDMVRLQDEAVKNRIGLWDKVTKDQLPKWLQREKPRILQNRK
jgi:endonuclease YncB( thermonuclease family)